MAAIEILKVSKLLPFLTDDLYARYTVHELDDLKDPSALGRVRAIVGGGDRKAYQQDWRNGAIVGGTAALETTWIEQIEAVDLDDLHPESLWRFKIRDFGPLLVAMDSHGGSLYREVQAASAAKRAQVLASLGVKA